MFVLLIGCGKPAEPTTAVFVPATTKSVSKVIGTPSPTNPATNVLQTNKEEAIKTCIEYVNKEGRMPSSYETKAIYDADSDQWHVCFTYLPRRPGGMITVVIRARDKELIQILWPY